MSRLRSGRLWSALAAIALLLSSPAVAQDGGRRFGDFTVECAEDLTCVAVTRGSNGDRDSVLQLGRRPDRRARWTIAISTLGALPDAERPVSLSVDLGVGVTLQPGSDYGAFVRPTDFYVLSQFALDRLMVRLQAGQSLRFSYIDIAGAPHTDRFSLKGFGAALTEIDRRQKRVAGDRRAGPPEDLPPAAPVDRQGLLVEAGLPPRLLDWHAASSTCEAPESETLKDVPPVLGPLSETAMLYAIPCFRGAGRTAYRLYLVESGEIGGMHLLVFAGFSPRFGWTGAETLDDVAYDPATRRLTGARKEADGCEGRGTWTWDAFALAMSAYEIGPGCGGGSGGWRPVFPAK